MRLCRPGPLSRKRRPGPREQTGIVLRTLRGGVHAQCGFSEVEPVNGLLILERQEDSVMILSRLEAQVISRIEQESNEGRRDRNPSHLRSSTWSSAIAYDMTRKGL